MAALSDFDITTEKSKLNDLSPMVIIEYIKTSIEILLSFGSNSHR